MMFFSEFFLHKKIETISLNEGNIMLQIQESLKKDAEEERNEEAENAPNIS